ncbi:50S ribosomal protein L23 [Entomobacter blattae]|uniref:50S ribosomal protein L23 n=1 Tax=Entomobacter blattae TaxID=2762277 RepID=A0A7H1NUA8_9PROT|nr:50S ribosomal protein L23 [Entomobacter blattae]QNT79368.1 hypothetical protein JGUZn3_21660 [Entomobacter blattae]
MFDMIHASLITEKATVFSEKSQVVFRIALYAAKPHINVAVKALLTVKKRP